MTGGRGKRLTLLALCLSGTLLFGALGIWQLQRLAWKRDLIARVDARVNAPPVPVPPGVSWSTLDLDDAEYRRVRARGHFLHEKETLVDAVTEDGPGSWVITPLVTAEGTILVNRGFVPPELRDSALRAGGQPDGDVIVTGLLRRPEPGGRTLRANRPEDERWFSRDVAAIAAARGLEAVAPFFIDADASPVQGPAPRGGLTVVHFRNAHLSYALTWFALAGLCVAGLVLLVRPPARPEMAGRQA
ncbi:MAG: SURF1 family protein [Pseudomonadota bacterium]